MMRCHGPCWRGHRPLSKLSDGASLSSVNVFARGSWRCEGKTGSGAKCQMSGKSFASLRHGNLSLHCRRTGRSTRRWPRMLRVRRQSHAAGRVSLRGKRGNSTCQKNGESSASTVRASSHRQSCHPQKSYPWTTIQQEEESLYVPGRRGQACGEQAPKLTPWRGSTACLQSGHRQPPGRAVGEVHPRRTARTRRAPASPKRRDPRCCRAYKTARLRLRW